MRKLWGVLLLPVIAAAQAKSEKDADITIDLDRRFKEAPTYTEPRHVNTALYEYPHQPVSLKFINVSPIVQKALKERAILQNIMDDSTFSLSKQVIVNVHELADEHGFFYLVDKDGGIRRRVHASSVIDMQKVTEMVELPKQYTEVTSVKNLNPYDKKLGFVTELGVRLGQTNAKWTADLLNTPKSAYTYSTTFAGNVLLDWEEKFRLGGTFQYETSSHNIPGGTAQYRNPSLGLIIQSPKSDWGGGPWRVGAQVRTGPFASLTVPNGNKSEDIKLRTTTIQLDWQYIDSNRWGEWALGIAFQRDYPKIRRQRAGSFLESDSRTNDQVGLFFNQGFTW